MTQSVEQAAQVPGRVIEDVTVQPAEHWARVVPQGSRVRFIDLEGKQAIDFLAYNAHDPSERYNAARHHEVRWQHLPHQGPRHLHRHGSKAVHHRRGHLRAPRHHRRAAVAPRATNSATTCPAQPNCRDTFLRGLAEHGLGKKDIVANLNFFMNVPVERDGNMALVEGYSNPGDLIELQAEMDAPSRRLQLPPNPQPRQRLHPHPHPHHRVGAVGKAKQP